MNTLLWLKFLCISQTSRGYGFYFIVNCDEYPIHYWPASYIYETWKNDSGEITEMRATNENYSVKVSVFLSIVWWGYPSFIFGQAEKFWLVHIFFGSLFIVGQKIFGLARPNLNFQNDINDHGMPIPNDFFASLYGLLRLHGITSMQIVDVMPNSMRSPND